MDEHFYNNDFEKFLQQQVKHHRMYPSDAVWKGIYKQMHGYKRWPGLYFFAILIVASLTVCTLFIETEPIVYSPQVVAKAITPIHEQVYPEATNELTLRKLQHEQLTPNADLTVTAHLTEGFTPSTAVADASSVDRPAFIAVTYDRLTENTINAGLINTPSLPSMQEDISATATEENKNIHQPAAQTKSITTALTATETEQQEEEGTKEDAINPVDEYLEQHPEEVDRLLKQTVRTKPSKWQLQFYIAPAMNYREIVDHKPSAEQTQGPISNNYGVSANKVVRYDPGMGIEFGFGAMYSLTNKLKIKAALQYNIRQYNIEAYHGATEYAKIAMVRDGNVDTITAVSKFRTTGTYGEAQLQNKYHQVSLPVGIEYSLYAGKRFGVSLGGTLQPTYTFSQSSYLISADYNSYADGRSILRRWNLNSSLEALFTYNARNVQWRFGPQLRYQHLPNYADPYPIKEYLIDYGFKIGFTKTIK